jgi:CHAT domain-containing protein/Flp pilus assembly protein TadD
LEEETKILKTLPGEFERLFLQSIILKRKADFVAMFDSLLLAFDNHSMYYPYLDELVFSAAATGQSSFLMNLFENSYKINQAERFYLHGLILSIQSEQKNALLSFLKADSLNPDNKNVIFNLIQTYKSLGDYKNSLLFIEKLKKTHSSDFLLKPKLLIAEGTLAYLSNDFRNAELLFGKALEHSIINQDKISQSKSLIDLGICEDVKGNIETGRKYFKQGIEIAKEINDAESIAFGNAELGVSYTYTNELTEAKKHYLAAYQLYKKLGNPIRLSLLSNNLGKLYMNFFDYKSALKYFEEGIQFAGGDKRAQSLNLIGLADVYSNLSNYSKALSYYREAQKISSQIKEITLQTEINTGLGALNFNINRFSNASFYYQFALELQSSTPNSYSAADINHKLGLTYFRIDSLKKAESHFKKAIDLASSNKNYFTLALTLGDLADLYISQKDLLSAKAYLSKARNIAENNGFEYLISELELLEGNINDENKSFEPAKRNYLNALKIAEKLNDFNLKIIANYSLGKLFHKNGFIEAAESYYKSGITLVEDASRPLFNESEVQISYFNARRDLYDEYIKLLLSKQNYEQAFMLIEKSRSRNTMQNLLNLKLASLIDDKLIEELFEIDWMINSNIYNKNEIDSLRWKLTTQKNMLVEKHPELKRILGANQINQLAELQSFLDDKENFISFYLTENNLFLFLTAKNKFKVYPLSLNRKQLIDLASQVSPYYNQTVRAQYFFNKDLFAFNAQAAYEFYKMVLKPLLDDIPKNERLIFSPPNELYAFPFEFLVSSFDSGESQFSYSDKNYLIEDYPISYSPSAAVYIEELQNQLSNRDKVLIVGDPDIDDQSEEFSERRSLMAESEGSKRNITLLPLRYSSEEVESIGDIIKTHIVFTAKDATETNFKQNAELSKIIHLSTHSLLIEKQPLIFFSNFYDPENDGFLEASEIVQLKLNTDLVVLSSCSSGLGKVDNSEGIMGMTKAFFDAGSKSIVVSLWEVNDKYTSKLMALFYQKLNEGYDKSEALRLAKVEFIKKYSPNPYFWAAFVLSGNTSKLKLESPSGFPPYITVLLAIALSMVLYYLFNRRKKKLQIS